MTRYLAAYETEMSSVCRPQSDAPSCREACRRGVGTIERGREPCTFAGLCERLRS